MFKTIRETSIVHFYRELNWSSIEPDLSSDEVLIGFFLIDYWHFLGQYDALANREEQYMYSSNPEDKVNIVLLRCQ